MNERLFQTPRLGRAEAQSGFFLHFFPSPFPPIAMKKWVGSPPDARAKDICPPPPFPFLQYTSEMRIPPPHILCRRPKRNLRGRARTTFFYSFFFLLAQHHRHRHPRTNAASLRIYLWPRRCEGANRISGTSSFPSLPPFLLFFSLAQAVKYSSPPAVPRKKE